jgi:hypothetical protein
VEEEEEEEEESGRMVWRIVGGGCFPQPCCRDCRCSVGTADPVVGTEIGVVENTDRRMVVREEMESLSVEYF